METNDENTNPPSGGPQSGLRILFNVIVYMLLIPFAILMLIRYLIG